MRLLIFLTIFNSLLTYGQSSCSPTFDQLLSDSIVKMWQLDQTAVGIPLKGMNWEEFSIYKDSIFHLNYSRIKEIFNSNGYLGYNEIGESTETSFWVFIHHCDFAPEFQSQVLDKTVLFALISSLNCSIGKSLSSGFVSKNKLLNLRSIGKIVL